RENRSSKLCKMCGTAWRGLRRPRHTVIISDNGRFSMPTTYSYATHVNVLYPPLEKVDVQPLVDACKDKWYNQTLCKVNDSVVRLGVMQGEYHWHKHDRDDEFFFVLEGHFIIDLEDRSVDLGPREGFVVPKGLVHRTRAPERAVILMVENAGIMPTGDEGEKMKPLKR